MREVRLKEIHLDGWKGRDFGIKFNTKRTWIKWKNGTGKSCIYKAFCWLLTGFTDADSSKNVMLFDTTKVLDKSNSKIKVTAKVEIDGLEYEIERSATATLTRNRETMEITKTGETYQFAVDGVAMNSSSFNGFIKSNIGDPEILPYMIIGAKLANMSIDDKKNARQVLENVVGSIDDTKVNGYNEKIGSYLKSAPLDDLITMMNKNACSIEKQIDTLAILFKEKEKEIASHDVESIKNAEEEFERIKDEIRIFELEGSKRIPESLQKSLGASKEEISTLKKKKVDAQIEYEEKQYKETELLKSKIRAAQDHNSQIAIQKKNEEEERKRSLDLMNAYESTLKSLSSLREKLIKQRNDIKERKFSATHCIYCGAPLSPEKLEEAERLFNESRDAELAGVIENGKRIRTKMNETEELIAKCKSIVEAPQKEYAFTPTDELESALKNLVSEQIPFEATNESISIERALKEAEMRYEKLATQIPDTTDERAELYERMSACKSKVSELAHVQSLIDQRDKMLKENARLCMQLSECQIAFHALKQFRENRYNMVSDAINDKLKYSKIEMFSVKKNGAVVPDCVIMDKEGVPYQTLNASAQNLVCLDIQRMMCDNYNVVMPIFVDEASIFDESHLPMFDTQTIYLMANDTNEIIEE